jgi:hypothetical protein
VSNKPIAQKMPIAMNSGLAKAFTSEAALLAGFDGYPLAVMGRGMLLSLIGAYPQVRMHGRGPPVGKK